MGTNATSTNPKRAAGPIALRILLAAALAALLLPFSALWAHAAGSVNISNTGSERYDGYSTNYFQADGQVAWCGQPNLPSPSGSFSYYTIDGSSSEKAKAMAVAMIAATHYVNFEDMPSRYGTMPRTPKIGSAVPWSMFEYLGEALGAGNNDDSWYCRLHVMLSYAMNQYDPGFCDPFKGATNRAEWENQSAMYWERCLAIARGSVPGYSQADVDYLSSEAGNSIIGVTNGGSVQNVIFLDKLGDPNGWIELTKSSANPDITDGNDCYTLEGAVYGIYPDAECTNQVATMTTNASGYAKSPGLKAGAYYVKEVTAPPSYALSTEVTPGIVRNGQTTSLTVTDLPQNDPAGILLGKFDGEQTYNGEGNLPQGSASLAGAEYTVRYYDGLYDTAADAEASGEPTRTWVLKTNENGYAQLDEDYLIDGDPLYFDSFGMASIPIGTILIQETKAPEGYLLDDDTVYIRQVTSEGSVETVKTYNMPEHPEQVKRGDLMLVKAAEDTSHRLANVPFKITSLTTGESHVLVTDANGEAKTCADWNAHTESTNANDEALNEDGTVDASKLDSRAGIWFGTSEPDNGHGALIYDDYKIEELRVDANEGHDLVVLPCVSITRDGYTVNIGTLDDRSMQVSTAARDGKTGSKAVAAESDATIIDRVDYRYATPGRNYTLKTWAQVYEDDERLCGADGEAIVIETPFAAVEADGYVEVEIPFDAIPYDGKHVVVFEQILDMDGNVVASHEDIDDPAQTVVIGDEGSLLPKTGFDHAALKGVLIAIATIASLIATGVGANLYLRRKGDEKAAS